MPVSNFLSKGVMFRPIAFALTAALFGAMIINITLQEEDRIRDGL